MTENYHEFLNPEAYLQPREPSLTQRSSHGLSRMDFRLQ